MADQLKIDPAQEFPHLARAPIVEAALEIRARAEAPWEELALLEQLKARLPDYPNRTPATRVPARIPGRTRPNLPSEVSGSWIEGFPPPITRQLPDCTVQSRRFFLRQTAAL